jgi:hypothetical protein
VLPALLALALVADPVAPAEPVEPAPPADEEFIVDVRDPRIDLTLWGGSAWTQGGGGPRADSWGGEATWRFDAVDLGLFGGTYGLRSTAADGSTGKRWAPVWLARVGQRFETRNGLLAFFTFGIGALEDARWRSWFQVALGARARFGPAFLSGELSFESDDFVRVAVGVGVSLF